METRLRMLFALVAGAMALAVAAVAWLAASEWLEARRQQASLRQAAALADRSAGEHLSQFATPETPAAMEHRWAAVVLLAGLPTAAAGWIAWAALRGARRLRARQARLKHALAHSRTRERLARRELMAAQERERHQLARELHDEFGQNLAVIASAAGYMERHAGSASAQLTGECAKDIRSAAAQMAQQMRSHLRRLYPGGLQDMDMRLALEELVNGQWLAAAGLKVHVRWPQALPPLAPEARLALYRTVQEALTNVVRHAGAREVEIALAPETGGLRVCIEDDGRADLQAVRRSERCGIRGMRERAEMAGGRLTLERSALGGLRVSLWLRAGTGLEDTQGDIDHGERVAAG